MMQVFFKYLKHIYNERRSCIKHTHNNKHSTKKRFLGQLYLHLTLKLYCLKTKQKNSINCHKLTYGKAQYIDINLNPTSHASSITYIHNYYASAFTPISSNNMKFYTTHRAYTPQQRPADGNH